MSCTRMLQRFFESDTTHDAISSVHSVSINMQNIEAHIVPIGVASTVGVVIGSTWTPVTTLSEVVSQLHQFVTPGYLYQHLSLPSMPHLSMAASWVLPAAAILDGVCRLGVGLSKITFMSRYAKFQDEEHTMLTEKTAKIMVTGLYETLCGLTTTSLGIYALAVASAPVACLTFAITNYLDAIPMLLGTRTPVAACFKVIEATGFLLCAFGMPLGGVLLAASAIHKLLAPAPTGNLKTNISEDVHRYLIWQGGYRSRDIYETTDEMKNRMQTVASRQVR